MSDFVKLSPALPGGDADGLSTLALDVTSLRVIIALVDCVEITTKTDTGILIPKIRLRRVEALLRGDAKTARLLMRRAWENRTGRDTLPLEIEDDFDRAFGADE